MPKAEKPDPNKLLAKWVRRKYLRAEFISLNPEFKTSHRAFGKGKE